MLHWTVHLKGAPVGRGGLTAVAVRHELYAFGGSSLTGDQIPVSVFNTVTLLWTKLPPETDCKGKRPQWVPSWRTGHTAVLIEDTVYICGGLTDNRNFCKSKPYAFDVYTHRWSKPTVSGTIPKARYDGAAWALGGVMYLHGGIIRYYYANDIHKLDTRTMVWSEIVPTGGQPPCHSAEHSANVVGTNVFVFGEEWNEDEREEEGYYIRVFDTTTSRWLNQSSARLRSQGKRLHHSAFAWHGELYVFGSKKRKKPRHLWKFSLQTSSWKKVRCKGKGPDDNLMCCCMVGDCVVLFGRYEGFNPVHDDLYVLDLSPSLKTLCKLAVIQHGLAQAELPHNIRWELEAMTGEEHTRPTEKKEDVEKNEAAGKSTISHWRY